MLGAQALDPRQPFDPLALAPLALAALGRQLTLELGLPDGQRALRGRRPALLDQPLGSPPCLASLRLAAFGLTQRVLRAHAGRLSRANLL